MRVADFMIPPTARLSQKLQGPLGLELHELLRRNPDLNNVTAQTAAELAELSSVLGIQNTQQLALIQRQILSNQLRDPRGASFTS